MRAYAELNWRPKCWDGAFRVLAIRRKTRHRGKARCSWISFSRVSWDDCEAFIGQLNAQVAELAARLPTEAEWERACRGETHGTTWVGELSGSAATGNDDLGFRLAGS